MFPFVALLEVFVVYCFGSVYLLFVTTVFCFCFIWLYCLLGSWGWYVDLRLKTLYFGCLCVMCCGVVYLLVLLVCLCICLGICSCLD